MPSFRESLHPRSTRAFQWYPVLQGEAAKIFLASVSSGIYVMWPNREKCCAWTVAERCGCLVAHLTSLFHTWWYHLIPNSFHKHHWSRASISSTSLLVTARHSEPYRKMARMWVLHSFSLVETEVFDFQMWLSTFCVAALVMALQHEISGSLELLKCQESYEKVNLCIIFS